MTDARTRRTMADLYRRSVSLMDAEVWSEADTALEELIALSERNDEAFFLGEACFRRILCLQALERDSEIPALRAKVSPESQFFIGAKTLGLKDI